MKTWEFYMINIGYCNAERYKCPPNEQYKYLSDMNEE